MLKENKIAFIICSNNELYCNECIWYIEQLKVPLGYEIEIICITEAESMAQGYNAAVNDSDAKYKIYLHQDVFIYYNSFLSKILEIFQADKTIGLIGVLGCKKLPSNAFACNAWDTGCTYICNYSKANSIICSQDQKYGWTEVEAIDGMLMATQYDIDWREDLDLGWDFYDISHSLEFTKRGYKIAVPFQKSPWCMHDCGRSKLEYYNESREIMLKEYREFFPDSSTVEWDLGYIPTQERIFEIIKGYIEKGMLESAVAIRCRIPDKGVGVNNLQYALNILDIYSAEKKIDNGVEKFFSGICIWDEIKNKYDEVKFLLRRVENGIEDDAVRRLLRLVDNGGISEVAIKIIIMHSILDQDKVMRRLRFKM